MVPKIIWLWVDYTRIHYSKRVDILQLYPILRKETLLSFIGKLSEIKNSLNFSKVYKIFEVMSVIKDNRQKEQKVMTALAKKIVVPLDGSENKYWDFQ